MDNLSYIDIKKLVETDYYDFIKDDGFTPEQSAAATMEDFTLMMKKKYKNYFSVIQSLSLICLQQGFITDYLLERLNALKDLNNLSDEEINIYENDKITLKNILEKNEFTIDIDIAFKARIDMLLE
ncbi:hypothetical protein HCJ28_04375 [Listeria sp. FSL L7-1434]|uniref:hypothetical protein n=1 Tax=Listeria cossartiae TaxID=2838249 RepID=UPI0016296C21|nr:hypothetical protein [Listeria cossartiae]MBC1549174.1 hypothetical protein [Listeria cossartiae subsp. cossartiae]MBC1567643.1 hypothetical protein [Listeria cossartiae subsp. cossartiae]